MSMNWIAVNQHEERAIRPRSRGFTLLELVVVIAIISILVTVALDRLLPLIDEAERVAVLRVEGQLRSTLVMEAAKRVVRGESARISELEGSNPVNFLLEPPKNYVGELETTETAGAPARHWYFDASSRRLVYRLGEAFGFRRVEETPENPAFAVRVAFTDADANGIFEPRRDEFYGVRLERVAGIDWLGGASLN